MPPNPLLLIIYHPHQLCFFVRGSSCAATEVDYYLLPSELEDAYLHATPAADSATTISAPTSTTRTSTTSTATTIGVAAGATTVSASTESITTATTVVATDRTADNTTTATTTASLSPSPGSTAVSPKKPLRVRVRPPWLETYSEQVVLLDWPLLVPQVRLFALSSLLSGFVLNFIIIRFRS